MHNSQTYGCAHSSLNCVQSIKILLLIFAVNFVFVLFLNFRISWVVYFLLKKIDNEIKQLLSRAKDSSYQYLLDIRTTTLSGKT